MALPLPAVPCILYCGIREPAKVMGEQLLRSETVEAALTRLMTMTGTIQTVDYKEHLANRQYYVIKLECAWPKGTAKAILDPKTGSSALRNDGYDVAVRTKDSGGYSFVILSPHEVVYQVIYQTPSTPPVVIATRYVSDTASNHHRRRPLGDPRQPQEALDSLVFKLNRPSNPLDQFSIHKIATSHNRDLISAKDLVSSILKRVIRGGASDRGDCWQYVLAKDESPAEVQLQALFLSFGRKAPEYGSGLKTVHQPPVTHQTDEGSSVEICVRPSHLRLMGSVDPSALKRMVENISTVIGQMGMEIKEK